MSASAGQRATVHFRGPSNCCTRMRVRMFRGRISWAHIASGQLGCGRRAYFGNAPRARSPPKYNARRIRLQSRGVPRRIRCTYVPRRMHSCVHACRIKNTCAACISPLCVVRRASVASAVVSERERDGRTYTSGCINEVSRVLFPLPFSLFFSPLSFLRAVGIFPHDVGNFPPRIPAKAAQVARKAMSLLRAANTRRHLEIPRSNRVASKVASRNPTRRVE